MRIAERMLLIVIFLSVCCWALSPGTGDAHPVAQGALEVVVFPERVSVTARVSMEEVLVAGAYSDQKTASVLEMVQAHGNYLLAHFRVTADGRQLDGRVIKLPEQADGRPGYELEYRLLGSTPTRLVFQQDALREFEFAPGNPWEASYLVRASRAGESSMEGLLLASREPLVIDLNSAARAGLDEARLVKAYIRHGVLHILSGYDHLLFIAALALAVTTFWDLVKVISAFTLAHSITLTLSALNVVWLSEGIVEPMIAASIVFVALQNVIVPERSRGAGRLSVAFFFGLFHGLGFAGGLLTAMEGMAGLAIGLAIVAFSLGVEIGHQIVVLPIFVALKMMGDRVSQQSAQIPGRVLRYGSAGICVAGLFYLFVALH